MGARPRSAFSKASGPWKRRSYDPAISAADKSEIALRTDLAFGERELGVPILPRKTPAFGSIRKIDENLAAS